MGIPDSVHQHYAMVAALSGELGRKLPGFKLKDGYTLSKEELVLVFEKNSTFFTLKIVQQYQTCFLFFETTAPDKISNAQPCFAEAFGQEIFTVHQHPFNRSFEFGLSNEMTLVFKMYDGLVNVLLFHRERVIDIFRKNITNDWALTPASFIGQTAVEMPVIKRFYLYKRTDIHPYYIAFTPQPHELVLESNSAMEVYSLFSKLALNRYRFVYLQQQLLNNTIHQIEKSSAHIKQLEQSLEQQGTRITDEETAHIIMANLFEIKPQLTTVELFDFYREKPVTIKLKKELNAQQNAAYYYRKSKTAAAEKLKLQEQINTLKQKRAQLEETRIKVETAASYRELKVFVKEKDSVEKQFPFRRFSAFGFDIWVGKNAANNDELTMRHSHKNDLWLHAKDVTGSHVLIKWKPGKEYTAEVITVAAQIAAYYSKLKGSGLVPVAYTHKKFVRKPKGAEPGSVAVDKEEIMMVTPKLPV
jgi:hypothetical protein